MIYKQTQTKILMIIMMKLEPSVSTASCIPWLVFQEKNIFKKLQPFYIIVHISYNPFIFLKGLQWKLDVKNNIWNGNSNNSWFWTFLNRFLILQAEESKLCGFFFTVCVCLLLLSKKKRKRNSKKPNAYSQFLFILKYIIIQFTKQTISGIIFSLTELHMFAF